jgi:hypothetical protein
MAQFNENDFNDFINIFQNDEEFNPDFEVHAIPDDIDTTPINDDIAMAVLNDVIGKQPTKKNVRRVKSKRVTALNMKRVTEKRGADKMVSNIRIPKNAKKIDFKARGFSKCYYKGELLYKDCYCSIVAVTASLRAGREPLFVRVLPNEDGYEIKPKDNFSSKNQYIFFDGKKIPVKDITY